MAKTPVPDEDTSFATQLDELILKHQKLATSDDEIREALQDALDEGFADVDADDDDDVEDAEVSEIDPETGTPRGG